MIINKIRELELIRSNIEKIPYETIYKKIKGLGLKNLPATVVPKGRFVLRAIPLEEIDFKTVSRISYNPDPSKFGRTHKPGFKVFYGAIATNKSNDAAITNFGEVSEILRNKVAEGKAKLTIGKWVVKEDLDVISIFHNRPYLEKNPDFKGVIDYYSERATQNDSAIMEYIANLFASENVSGLDSFYKLSAAFSEYMFTENRYKVGALLYPSVQAGGEGINISIRPGYVKSHLVCTDVVTCTLYLKGKNVVSDWNKYGKVNEKTGTFILKEKFDKTFNIGEDKCIAILNEMFTRSTHP